MVQLAGIYYILFWRKTFLKLFNNEVGRSLLNCFTRLLVESSCALFPHTPVLLLRCTDDIDQFFY